MITNRFYVSLCAFSILTVLAAADHSAAADPLLEMYAGPASKGDEGFSFQVELAFRAGLDGSAMQALDPMLATGADIKLVGVNGPQGYVDTNSDHRRTALSALSQMANAMGDQDLRHAYSDKNFLLGFPTAHKPAAERLFWPRDPAGASLLLEKASGERTALPGNTILFEADPADGGSQIYACATVAGCGYLSSTAVEPVLAMWISFERSTKEVVGLYIGENTLRHE